MMEVQQRRGIQVTRRRLKSTRPDGSEREEESAAKQSKLRGKYKKIPMHEFENAPLRI